MPERSATTHETWFSAGSHGRNSGLTAHKDIRIATKTRFSGATDFGNVGSATERVLANGIAASAQQRRELVVAFQRDENELGCLWEKSGGRGTYMTGTINGQAVVVFRNDRKAPGSKQPDWRVLKSKPKTSGSATPSYWD